MPYLHHGKRPRFRGYKKFKSPRKRASKLLDELNKEAVEKSKKSNPVMWDAGFRVGDSIELKMVTQGGVHAKDGDSKSQDIEKISGVVLGIVNRGLNSSVILRDVVYGLPIERKIPMHSPMIKEATVLARNFIFKGKKKVKRAKLYYFRDLNPLCKSMSCLYRLYRHCMISSFDFKCISIQSKQGVQVLDLLDMKSMTRVIKYGIAKLEFSIAVPIITFIYTVTVVLDIFGVDVSTPSCCFSDSACSSPLEGMCSSGCCSRGKVLRNDALTNSASSASDFPSVSIASCTCTCNLPAPDCTGNSALEGMTACVCDSVIGTIGTFVLAAIANKPPLKLIRCPSLLRCPSGNAMIGTPFFR